MSVGTEYTIMPIPPVEAVTTWIDVGVLKIGIEPRSVDDDLLAEHFTDLTPEQEEMLAANKPEVLDDGGVSLHVAGSSDGVERLRFDCFNGDPHYHYIRPEEQRQEIIKFDEVAHGRMLDWALRQLASGLAPMLAHVGQAHLATALDDTALQAALPEVQQVCRDLGVEC
jgi:hypothetical protein